MNGYEIQCMEDARLAILAELAQQGDGTLNSRSMTRVLDGMGIRRDQNWVETQIVRLFEMGAVKTKETELPGIGRVVIATLTSAGRNHVERRARIVGVSVPADPE